VGTDGLLRINQRRDLRGGGNVAAHQRNYRSHADTIWKALRLFNEGNADFADYLIERSANEAGCSHMSTFDRDAAKHSGMQLIE
jgi:predicted nucleic-acid-binding protein